VVGWLWVVVWIRGWLGGTVAESCWYCKCSYLFLFSCHNQTNLCNVSNPCVCHSTPPQMQLLQRGAQLEALCNRTRRSQSQTVPAQAQHAQLPAFVVVSSVFRIFARVRQTPLSPRGNSVHSKSSYTPFAHPPLTSRAAPMPLTLHLPTGSAAPPRSSQRAGSRSRPKAPEGSLRCRPA